MRESSVEPRFASIDIGSHTLRLLIARMIDQREIHPLHQDRRITRLARNFSQTETLSDESMARSLSVLGEFAALLRRYRVQAVSCGATGVVRRALNAAEFLQRIEKANGFLPAVLTEEREAFLSAKGVLSGLPQTERHVLLFDLGGSSTELMLIDCDQGRSLWSASVFVGAATVTERFLPGDPPAASTLVSAREAVGASLNPSLSQLKSVLRDLHLPVAALQVVGTAGTATTLAAMLLEMTVYDPSRINGLILTQGWLARIIGQLAQTPLREREKVTGLEKGREGIILGGALIVDELLRALEQRRVMVVDSGLLEGMLLALIEEACGWPESLVSPLTLRQTAIGGSPLVVDT